MLTLTTEQRRDFALYCRMQARDLRGIISQMQKVGVPKAMTDNFIQDMAAFERVANTLEATHTEEM